MAAWVAVNEDKPATSVVQPGPTDRIYVLLDSAGDLAAVNCRQRHARHDRRTAFALVRGALGGVRFQEIPDPCRET
jgi:hypothetical protein